MFKIHVLIITLFLFSCHHEESEFIIDDQRPIEVKIISPYFLSFALDLAQVAGGKWWEGSSDFSMGRCGRRATPFDFKRERLKNLASMLSPFILRVGGSEADSIYYSLTENKSIPKGFQTTLTSSIWNDLYQFSRLNDGKLLFTLNIGPGYRKNRKLQFSHFHKLFSYIKESGHQVSYFELGNELNAFFLNYGFSGQITEKQYAFEFLEVKKIMKNYFPSAKLIGPANAWWPFMGEVFSSIAFSSRKLLTLLNNEIDIFTWHYYPTQSHRCPININKSTENSMLNHKTRSAINPIMKNIEENIKNFPFSINIAVY